MKAAKRGAAMVAAIAIGLAAVPAPTEWRVDIPHTAIGFTVNHFFTPVRGTFDHYDIELSYDPERPENSSAQVRIDVESVNA